MCTKSTGERGVGVGGRNAVSEVENELGEQVLAAHAIQSKPGSEMLGGFHTQVVYEMLSAGKININIVSPLTLGGPILLLTCYYK